MAILQPLIDLAQLCHLHGVTHAVISPGSRSAALTLAFARNPNIACQVVMDERAAGFIALGMAQQLKKPVVLICTSGSAAYNFAPAVAEAFFQQIPLLILTADRPKEWIHQNDGQTIYQAEIYSKHVKGFWDLPADHSHPDSLWFINRSLNEALLTAKELPCGPVHLNVPIREPFYPTKDEIFAPSENIRIIKRAKTQSVIDEETWVEIRVGWEGSEKILIAVGQQGRNDKLNELLRDFALTFKVPIVGDVISNLENNEHFITKQDLFLRENSHNNLRPDLLITVGKSFISKNLKSFLRNNSPKIHWHISDDLHIIDTFQTLTQQLNVSPNYFFSRLYEILTIGNVGKKNDKEKSNPYLSNWLKEEAMTKHLLTSFLTDLTTLNDITAISFILKRLPEGSQLHLANSMTVRYVNLLGIEKEGVEVFCNRGTSGIDGCVSTAIGAALTRERPVYLIVGDVAFFYDRNGLLIDDLPQNLKIILINNAGGTIFRMIDGPASQPELPKYFETHHHYNGLRTAEDSKITYFLIQNSNIPNLENLANAWKDFTEINNTAILEIQTNAEYDAAVFRDLKKFVAKRK